MCCNVFLSINFNLSQFHLFLTIVCFYFDSYLSLLAYFIEETNNYFTYFRNYLPFCIYMRSDFISGILTIVSPGRGEYTINSKLSTAVTRGTGPACPLSTKSPENEKL